MVILSLIKGAMVYSKMIPKLHPFIIGNVYFHEKKSDNQTMRSIFLSRTTKKTTHFTRLYKQGCK